MEEKTYLGAQWGKFRAENGNLIPYRHLFVMEPFSSADTDDYHSTGYKAAKYKLADASLVDGLEPFDVVEVYFNSKSVVTKLVKKCSVGPVEKVEQKKAS